MIKGARAQGINRQSTDYLEALRDEVLAIELILLPYQKYTLH